MTRVLTLDQATRSGWAFGIAGSEERWEFGSLRMPKRDDDGERLVILRDGLVDLIERFHPDLVGYETPFFPVEQPRFAKVPTSDLPDDPKGGGARFSIANIKLAFRIEGVLIETTARYSIPTESFASSTWRVTALGFGRLPKGSPAGEWKRLMVRRAKSLGYEVADDNEAEAIGILIHMLMGAPAARRRQGDLLDMARGRL